MATRTAKGQATLEYLLVLSFVMVIAVRAVRGINEQMGGQIGGLVNVMTRELAVGVCDSLCFYKGYKNGEE